MKMEKHESGIHFQPMCSRQLGQHKRCKQGFWKKRRYIFSKSLRLGRAECLERRDYEQGHASGDHGKKCVHVDWASSNLALRSLVSIGASFLSHKSRACLPGILNWDEMLFCDGNTSVYPKALCAMYEMYRSLSPTLKNYSRVGTFWHLVSDFCTCESRSG